MKRKPVVLIIRDGWGENHNSDHDPYNAIKLSNIPVSEKISKDYPRTELEASGEAVGLPEGVMGNSEVGHQNIGAGRVVDQEIVRLNKGFKEGHFKTNPVIETAFKHGKSGKLHLFGIVSDAGVHGILEHLFGLVALAKEAGVEEVYLHAFTDGRDTPPKSGLGYIKEIESKFEEIGLGKIATVSGRYWAMDRDLRWDRIEKVYNNLTGKKVLRTASSAVNAVQSYYDNPEDPALIGDEFIPSTQIISEGKAIATIEDGDAVIFYNFRGDRPRELTRAFIEDGFSGFDRGNKLNLYYSIMTNYQKGLCPNVVLDKPSKMDGILGVVVNDAGIPQFRCAETEKFPHVTFFFNDYREEALSLEDRAIIPSPKEVATYDLKPEMSAKGVFDATKEAILSGKYGLIVVNFANPDMVGHTGCKEAILKAVEIVDKYVGDLLEAVKTMEGSAIVTADHGNCDQMYNVEIESLHTSHTLNPVEVVVVSEDFKNSKLLPSGKLENIAPTILQLMGIEKPAAMTGKSLIVESKDQ